VRSLAEQATARIGLISDTHCFPNGARVLSSHVLAYFRRAEPDLILHAGDICHQGVLDELAEISPVMAVRGNNDSGEFGDSLPLVIRTTIAGYRICLVHGHEIERSARRAALSLATDADIVIYGHSHIPMMEKVGDTLVVNPGSPTDRRFEPHFGIGLLDLTPDRAWPELILFAKPEDLDRASVPPR